jgi:hypothetical protein
VIDTGHHRLSMGRISVELADDRFRPRSPAPPRSTNGRNRRILLVAVRSGEGPLTAHITATQAQPPERILLPHSGSLPFPAKEPNFHGDLGELLGPAARAFRSTMELQRAGSQEHPIGIDATAVHPFGTTLFSP